jgi:hypothetical protein
MKITRSYKDDPNLSKSYRLTKEIKLPVNILTGKMGLDHD